MSKREIYAPSPGAIRPSQLITTFGPGSIMQTEYDSIIVMGINFWFNKDTEHKKFRPLNHPHLEKRLGVTEFKTPRAIGNSRLIPCKSFPTWGVCPKCSRLQRHRSIPADGMKTFRCDSCNNGKLNPARFITICDNGHLDDFPWEEWAHSDNDGNFHGLCKKNPKLNFWAGGNSQTLADFKVTCTDCNKTRSCKDAVSPHGLRNIIRECNGSSPWLSTKQKCLNHDKRPSYIRGIQLRSSTLYFPVIASAIYIPKWLHPIQDVITDHKTTIEDLRQSIPPMSYKEIVSKMRFFDKIKKDYSIDEIVKHLDIRFSKLPNNDKHSTEREIRDEEFFDLMHTSSSFVDKHKNRKALEIESVQINESFSKYITDLKKLKRITEIKVLRAFTRNIAPDPYSADKSQRVEFCRIYKKKPNWLPAVENKGEGIFLTLNDKKIKEWENNPQVKERCDAIIDGFTKWAQSREWETEEKFKPRYILLHTLSHTLIREMANISGYNEASIQERIYYGDNHTAILLYTSSSSSDGSLGGLVRQGDFDNFKKLLRSALHSSLRCSRDPLCVEDDPVQKRKLNVNLQSRINGSACYGCSLLPETSCENSNRLLDRNLLCSEKFGFFKEELYK